MPVLELSGWYDLGESARKDVIRAYVEELTAYVAGLPATGLTTDIRNATEISTPSVLLSLPADQALSGLKGVGNDQDAMVEAMYQNILAWEEELFVANKVQGIIDSDAALADYRYPMTTRQNIRYMRMFAGAFMYAAGNHVGVEYGSTAALVQGKPTSATGAGTANGLFGWGIAHEIGHNMDKLGKAEMHQQHLLPGPPGLGRRLHGPGHPPHRRRPLGARSSTRWPRAAPAPPTTCSSSWACTGSSTWPMTGPTSLWPSTTLLQGLEGRRIQRLLLRRAGGPHRLQGGRPGPDRVLYPLGHDPQRRREGHPGRLPRRGAGHLVPERRLPHLPSGETAAAADGTASVTAAVSESKVTLTISHTDSAHILGYEIRRNGKAIAFTTETTYVDDLGAANNLTYTYSVVPVDKLGNLGTAAQSNEVRVAYDKTISADLYTLEQGRGGTVTITMKDGAAVPVTGIKVTGDRADRQLHRHS